MCIFTYTCFHRSVGKHSHFTQRVACVLRSHYHQYCGLHAREIQFGVVAFAGLVRVKVLAIHLHGSFHVYIDQRMQKGGIWSLHVYLDVACRG